MCLLGAMSKTRNMPDKVGNGLGQGPWGAVVPDSGNPLKGLWSSVPRSLSSESVTHLIYPMIFLYLTSFLLTSSSGMVVFS